MLYRVAELSDWEQAQQTGYFASADLQAEGFIHTSELHQLLETANRYYLGRADVVLLELDEATLGAAGVLVKREWAESRGQYFAHVFGPIPLRAIVRAIDMQPDPEGRFRMPAQLEG
ncbi:DUF952 domain-containing protein [Hymenobacter latericus]|uniref:DUF952 domain-containing protein n=1 Tax=Hymenobacter sp. YIM 151858-1 TaxID=2987688 RepID=UPI002226283E|nr:DUF952 domain-containing protein [Hymenobacter sp. YIM 151858-1]UYZ59604.1 DUF952 domain-containing protein [Hymenobacter sp. YIM 151858-1]